MIKKATNVQYSYIISGNGIQNGNPSPSNILPFDGCGDKTENLLDYTTVENTSTATASQISDGISVSGRYFVQFKTVKFTVGRSYTMSWTTKTVSGTVTTMWRFRYSDNTYSSMPSSGGSLVVEKEVVALLLYVNVSSTESGVAELTNIMLNVGSTALPYKPYGYVLPIEYDNNISASIYLGQVETTRNIKKLVLTGNETVDRESNCFRIPLSLSSDSVPNVFSTHLPYKAGWELRSGATGICTSTTYYGTNYKYLLIRCDEIATVVTDFKSYLAAQYAVGTPVTVWYVLKTPETTITNEPLMKIGNYVDTINNTQSGIDITTNNLTVNTTIPPSDISINTTATWVPIPYNKYNTETISTIAPIDFLSNGQNITVGLKGNTEQLEIPSPDNPVMPEGTGDKTGNLLNLNRTYSGTFTTDTTKWMNGAATVNNTGIAYAETEILGDRIKVTSKSNGYGASFLIKASPNTTYTVSFETDKESSSSWGGISDRDINGTVISNSAISGKSATFTTHDNCAFLNVCFRFPPADGTVTFSKIMLNTGSTPLPYEPYGYKLNISSNGENLFDEIYPDLVQGQTVKYKPVYVGEGNFTLSTDYPLVQAGTADLFLLPGNVSSGASTVSNGVYFGQSRTVSSVSGYVTIGYRKYSATHPLLSDYHTMLNKGSTPLPYSPYNHTTTPVYLGEVETTRVIRKYEFTGNENWQLYNSNYWTYALDSTAKESQIPLCSHFLCSTSTGIYISNGSVRTKVYAASVINVAQSLDEWKTYLQQQYQNGTPVCLWYVLATPTTSIVNEPLMRIGDYTDEVSNITVPTTKGSNTLSVNTSVQPSNVQVSIPGWVPHNNVKEYKNNAWMATSWEGFRDIVRAGNSPTRYPIGTKLYETWGDNTSNAWIIVDYDNSNYNDPDISALGYTHNVVLYEEKINYLKVFDNAEAWLYTESVLPAGTYRFTIPNYDATYGGNKTYIFTSTVDVPIHGQLTLSWPYQQNPVSVSAYTTNTSTTALFTATVAEWDGTTTSEDLGTIKLAMTDPDSTYGKLNHIHRARYGSNNYYQSGIRQWMNSDATANNWWKPANIFDRPYSNRTSDGGLYLINEDFKKVIAAPNITCITNNTFETGAYKGTPFKLQTNYTVRDKIFLPTHTELNLSSNPNICTVFSQYTNAGNDDRIKYRKDNGNAYYYWFRTPYPSGGNGVRYVRSSGALNNYSAYNTIGAVRACIIQ